MCSTYRKGSRLLEIKGVYWMYEIGRTDGNPDAKGLVIPNIQKSKDCITILETYSV